MAEPGFVSYVLELLEPLGGCSARAMFGGHGIYRGGAIFGLVVGDRLYLKADAQTEVDFIGVGSAPFVYQGKGRAVQMSYWNAPDDALESSDEMIRWARLALAAASRKALATPVKRKPAKSEGGVDQPKAVAIGNRRKR